MTETSPCLVCDLGDADIIQQTDNVVAAYYTNAIKHGHFIVAVKRHVPTFGDITPDEAAELLSVAQQLVKKSETLNAVEKHYLVAIGDVDAHFHIHCIPKLVDDPKLGPHVMSPNGWRGTLPARKEESVAEFVSTMKSV
ncbi:MAG: HIT domain-containing protein [Planctomycetaceae bacterium]|nr:HIT domain-containing protein [Planctomycetales bacterium]MCB9924354.1 HIT domain-containing protein [Planctomycetaceae bacterium]